jgi:hypothetical protein
MTLFAAPDLLLEEVQNANGASVLRGTYKGETVRQALVVQNGEECVVLLEPFSCLELRLIGKGRKKVILRRIQNGSIVINHR